MTKFRPHRGSLEDALKETIVVANRQHLRNVLGVGADALEIKPYGFDARIGWNTHIVTVKGQGVVGFTDGPLLEDE